PIERVRSPTVTAKDSRFTLVRRRCFKWPQPVVQAVAEAAVEGAQEAVVARVRMQIVLRVVAASVIPISSRECLNLDRSIRRIEQVLIKQRRTNAKVRCLFPQT